MDKATYRGIAWILFRERLLGYNVPVNPSTGKHLASQ